MCQVPRAELKQMHQVFTTFLLKHVPDITQQQIGALWWRADTNNDGQATAGRSGNIRKIDCSFGQAHVEKTMSFEHLVAQVVLMFEQSS